MLEKNNIQMIEEIKDIIISSRNKIAYEVNNTMLPILKNLCINV